MDATNALHDLRPRESPTTAHLKGFERVELTPDESKSISIPLNAFAFYDVAAKKWSIDPGKFTIHVGDNIESTRSRPT